MNKLIKVAKNPLLMPLFFLRKSAGWIKDDEFYLKIYFLLRMKSRLHLNPPKTFSEKLQWLKLYQRRKEYTQMVDKYEAKHYVEKIIGKEYIIPTLGIWDKFEDINFQDLPEQFVLKCTHDSGGIVICKDKSQLNIEAARKKINQALKHNFYLETREYPYKEVRPRIIAEKYIEDPAQSDLLDYKIWFFNGKPKVIYVCSDRKLSSKPPCVNYYDMNWNLYPFRYTNYKNSSFPIKKPSQLDKMVQLAEILVKNISAPFVRIDFYQVNEHPYFGEITFFPGSGCEKFTPSQWDYEIGEWLQLPEK